MIVQAPVVMECSVEDIYETKGFDNFICTIDNTYAGRKCADRRRQLITVHSSRYCLKCIPMST